MHVYNRSTLWHRPKLEGLQHLLNACIRIGLTRRETVATMKYMGYPSETKISLKYAGVSVAVVAPNAFHIPT